MWFLSVIFSTEFSFGYHATHDRKHFSMVSKVTFSFVCPIFSAFVQHFYFSWSILAVFLLLLNNNDTTQMPNFWWTHHDHFVTSKVPEHCRDLLKCAKNTKASSVTLILILHCKQQMEIQLFIKFKAIFQSHLKLAVKPLLRFLVLQSPIRQQKQQFTRLIF